jgi:hypothetical protein
MKSQAKRGTRALGKNVAGLGSNLGSLNQVDVEAQIIRL